LREPGGSHFVDTDSNGFYSFSWTNNGPNPLFVTKAGYEIVDPTGTLRLESLYGAAGHDITFSSAATPGVTLHYTTFEAITRDMDDARIYGGIHFRFDQEAGGLLGHRVGAYICRHYLREVRP
jgi:hypothetical protein